MLQPRPRSGSYSASTDLPAVFKAPTSKGSEGGRGSWKKRRRAREGEAKVKVKGGKGGGGICGTNVQLVATRLVELLLMGRSLDNADG